VISSAGRPLRRGLALTGAVALGTLAVIAALVAITATRSNAAQTRSEQTRSGQAGSDVASPGDGVGAAAQALLNSPLYVHPDMAWLLTTVDETKIERALRASPVRVFLAVVPLNPDDDDALSASYFLDQLFRRMHRPGVYLAVGPSGNIYDAEYLVPRDITLGSVEEESVFDSPGAIASNTPGRILAVLHLIAASPADPQQAISPTPLYTPGEFDNSGGSSGSPSAAGQIAAAGIASFLFAGPLLTLTGFGLVAGARRYAANRRGWGDAGDPGLPAGRMPRSPSSSWLRRHAQGELAALGQLIATGNDTNPGWSRACDDYDAGKLVLTPTAEQVDLVGAIVLARDGRLAVAWKTAAPPPPCLVNPLHGRSVGDLPGGNALGLLSGRIPGRGIPVCSRCARAARRGRVPRLGNMATPAARLLLVKHEGKRMPYFAFRNLWWDAWSGSSGRSLPQAIRERLGVS
jgi:hypothetical protein